MLSNPTLISSTTVISTPRDLTTYTLLVTTPNQQYTNPHHQYIPTNHHHHHPTITTPHSHPITKTNLSPLPNHLIIIMITHHHQLLSNHESFSICNYIARVRRIVLLIAITIISNMVMISSGLSFVMFGCWLIVAMCSITFILYAILNVVCVLIVTATCNSITNTMHH